MKFCAKKWDMNAVMWMFKDHPDQEADVTMMLELRSEISEHSKGADRIVAISHGSDNFKKIIADLSQVINNAKARCAKVCVFRFVELYFENFGICFIIKCYSYIILDYILYYYVYFNLYLSNYICPLSISNQKKI